MLIQNQVIKHLIEWENDDEIKYKGNYIKAQYFCITYIYKKNTGKYKFF